MSKPIYTRITTHRGQLVISHEQRESNEIVTSPFDSSSMGFVIGDTAYIGISAEAHEVLKTIRRGRGAIGDIDLFRTSDGLYALATLGGANVLVNPKDAEGSRDYQVPEIKWFQIIENEVPQGAVDAIEG
jgi:hypothetical protein